MKTIYSVFDISSRNTLEISVEDELYYFCIFNRNDKKKNKCSEIIVDYFIINNLVDYLNNKKDVFYLECNCHSELFKFLFISDDNLFIDCFTDYNHKTTANFIELNKTQTELLYKVLFNEV